MIATLPMCFKGNVALSPNGREATSGTLFGGDAGATLGHDLLGAKGVHWVASVAEPYFESQFVQSCTVRVVGNGAPLCNKRV